MGRYTAEINRAVERNFGRPETETQELKILCEVYYISMLLRLSHRRNQPHGTIPLTVVVGGVAGAMPGAEVGRGVGVSVSGVACKGRGNDPDRGQNYFSVVNICLFRLRTTRLSYLRTGIGAENRREQPAAVSACIRRVLAPGA